MEAIVVIGILIFIIITLIMFAIMQINMAGIEELDIVYLILRLLL